MEIYIELKQDEPKKIFYFQFVKRRPNSDLQAKCVFMVDNTMPDIVRYSDCNDQTSSIIEIILSHLLSALNFKAICKHCRDD